MKRYFWGPQALLLAPFFLILSNCSVTAVRPAQEMSNMEVAIKSAKEVNADVLAPELYRRATEQSLLARKEYRFKDFEAARNDAEKARILAERAEFESIRNGGKRESVPQDPLAQPSYPAEPTSPGTPTDPVAVPSPSGAPAPKN